MIINENSKGVLFSQYGVNIFNLTENQQFNSVFNQDWTQQLYLLREDGKFERNYLYINWNSYTATASTRIYSTKKYSFDFSDFGYSIDTINSFVDLCNNLFSLYRSKFRFDQSSSNSILFKNNGETDHAYENYIDLSYQSILLTSPLIVIHEILHFLILQNDFTSVIADRQHYTLDTDYGDYTNQQLMLGSSNGLFLDYFNNLLAHGVNPSLFTEIYNYGDHILRTHFLPELNEIGFRFEDREDYIRSFLPNFDLHYTTNYQEIERRISNVNPHKLLYDISNILENPIPKSQAKFINKRLSLEAKYLGKFYQNYNFNKYIIHNKKTIQENRINLANVYLQYIGEKYSKLKNSVLKIRSVHNLKEVNLFQNKRE